jgi:hypothetical protein
MTTELTLLKILQEILHTENESKQSTREWEGEEKVSNQIVALIWLHTPKALNKQKNLNGNTDHILININTKCQWIQLPHQKIPFGKGLKKKI